MEYRKNLSNSLKGKTGGYRVKSGNKKFKSQYYNNIWMDSSWEVEFAKRCDFLKIAWIRNGLFLEYFGDDNRIHKYHPDFYLPERKIFIEIIGYHTKNKYRKLYLVLKKNNDIKLKIINNLNDIKTFE